MTNYESLLAEAVLLPVADRIQLIDAIWDSVPDDALPPLSAEWAAEIERRTAEFDAGLAAPIPWEEIKTDAVRRLSRNGE